MPRLGRFESVPAPHGDQVTLSVEHRAAASIAALSVHLAIDGDAVALATIDHQAGGSALPPPAITDKPTAPAIAQTIEAHLAAAAIPTTAAALRKACQIRNAKLTATIADLVAAGRIAKTPTGYVISR